VWKEIGAEPVPLTLPELHPGLKEGKAEIKMRDSQEVDRVDIGMVTKRVLGIIYLQYLFVYLLKEQNQLVFQLQEVFTLIVMTCVL
jgi:hypothetical protein